MSVPRPQSLGTSAAIAAWGAAYFGAGQMAGAMLDANPTAAAAVQAVIAEWGSGRLGVQWSDPEGPAQNARSIARRAGLGAALGIGAAALVLATTLVAHLSSLARNAPSIASLGIGLLIAGLVAARDELLLHGVVLRMLQGTSVSGRLLACGLTSAAASLGTATTTLPEAAASGLCGMGVAALWLLDRGAWMAWGARTAWLLGTGTLVHGGLLDVRAAATAWAGSDAGFSGGWCAVAVLGALSAVALYLAKRRELRPSVPRTV